MGYYSFFKFDVIDKKTKEWTPDADLVIDALLEKSGYGSTLLEDEVKWYDHEKDCIAISASFPDVIIIVDREGEESGDFARDYYCNGKLVSDVPEIVYKEPHEVYAELGV